MTPTASSCPSASREASSSHPSPHVAVASPPVDVFSPSVDMERRLNDALKMIDTLIMNELSAVMESLLQQVEKDYALQQIGRKRRRFKKEEVASICNTLEMIQKEGGGRATVSMLQEVTGIKTLNRAMLHRWKSAGPCRRVGRKVNVAFEEAVLGEVIYTTLVGVDGQERAGVVVANVCYSHEIVQAAAAKVRAFPEFRDVALVKTLQFTRPWVKGWMRRNALRRRRVTAQGKDLPEPDIVQKRMEEIQHTIVEGGFDASQVINGDETGMLFGEPPRYQYVPADAERATTPEADERSRFTCFLAANAAGAMLPTFSIVRCASRTPEDLSRTRVLHNMHEKPGFTPADGWALKLWEKSLALPTVKKALEVKCCKRWYLVHSSHGHVITCHNQAWMDSIGVAMLVDLVLGPYVQTKLGGKGILVWDNCSAHKVDALREIFSQWNISVESLPPRMTDILQVMDLVVNGPLKAAIRRQRAMELFMFFQEWKIRRLTAYNAQQPLPTFKPPKPQVHIGIQTLLTCVETNLTTPRCQQSLRECFIRVGLWHPLCAPSEFVKYTSHTKAGSLKSEMFFAGGKACLVESGRKLGDKKADEVATFGEIVTEFTIEKRYDVEEVDADEQEQDEACVEYDDDLYHLD